jgi:hypothetical protein
MPSVLIAVPVEWHERLRRTFLWRADMSRTFAKPAEVFGVARTLGPDVIIVMPDGPLEAVSTVIQNLRGETVTRDSVIVVLSDKPDEVLVLESSGASLILPYDFADGDRSPWHQRVEALMRIRRRRETRVSVEFSVDVWRGEPGLPGRAHQAARGLNLSSRGLLLELVEPEPVGTRLELTFVAQAGLPTVSVIGEVVRAASTADGRFLAGIHFVVVRKEARLAIRDTLRALRPPGAEEASEEV